MAKPSDPNSFSMMHHFAQANPRGEGGQGDVPALLRRVADTIESIAGAVVQDLVLHDEINEHGQWYHLVVYYSLAEDA